jgi:hypothetical protein
MQTPEPTIEHQHLARLVGEWTGDEHIHPSPWDPEGAEAFARVRNVAELGGLAVVQRYDQERGGRVAFSGLGVFRWDAAAGEHVLLWLDTLSPHPREFRGAFAGSVLTMVSREARGQARATWDFRTPDEYAYRLDASPDGVDWRPYIEAVYRRAG